MGYFGATGGKTVHEVLYDLPEGVDGRAGDGMAVARFFKKADAEAFAVAHEVYGKPCVVSREDHVPARIVSRWCVQ